MLLHHASRSQPDCEAPQRQDEPCRQAQIPLVQVRQGELTKAFGLIFGIVPEHQRKGVEGALIMSFAKLALSEKFPYKELEFNWIGDFNPSMMHLLDQIGAKIIKTHITYRYPFDRERPLRAGSDSECLADCEIRKACSLLSPSPPLRWRKRLPLPFQHPWPLPCPGRRGH